MTKANTLMKASVLAFIARYSTAKYILVEIDGGDDGLSGRLLPKEPQGS